MEKVISKARPDTFVVVGGCAAGMSAASKAKRMNPNLRVVVFEKSPHVSYSACGIPYFVADLVREPAELISITAEEFREKRGIDVHTFHEVQQIDAVRRRIHVVDRVSGKERAVDYDRLLLSVGGKPNRPAIPGIEGTNVFTLQTLQDGIRLKDFVDNRRPRNAVIIGGGYIAMEMAEALRLRDLQVTVVEKCPHILPGFDPEIRAVVLEEMERHRVAVLTGQEVQALLGEAEVDAVQTAESTVPADLILVATGISANTLLAEHARVRTGITGAVCVDWKMRTNVENIYAAGDCVEVRNIVSGKADYAPLGPTANKQGRIAGENIGGGTAKFPGVVGTSVFKVFDLQVARTGLNEEQAGRAGFHPERVTITEKPKAAIFTRNERLTISVIFDRRNGRFLGAQMVGQEGVSKRIDVFATALMNKLTLDQMAYLDLSYAPPFAPVWDPVLVAVNVARAKLKK